MRAEGRGSVATSHSQPDFPVNPELLYGMQSLSMFFIQALGDDDGPVQPWRGALLGTQGSAGSFSRRRFKVETEKLLIL